MMNQLPSNEDLIEKARVLDKGPSRPDYPQQFAAVVDQLVERYCARMRDLPVETESIHVDDKLVGYRVKHSFDLGYEWPSTNGLMNIVVSFENVRESHVDYRNDLLPNGWVVSTYVGTLAAISTVLACIYAVHIATRIV